MTDPLRTLQDLAQAATGNARRYTPRRALAATGDSLSRRGLLALRVECATVAMGRLLVLCYERDTDGGWANVDAGTGALLVRVPWRNYADYGLRKAEGETLRALLLARQGAARLSGPVVYDGEVRRWLLDFDGYATAASAAAYWQRHPLTLGEWRATVERLASERRSMSA